MTSPVQSSIDAIMDGIAASNDPNFIKEQLIKGSFFNECSFNYVNKEGKLSTKHCEIYGVKDDSFFGWDLAEGKTKMFNFSSMSSFVMGKEMAPRFAKKE